MDSIYAGGNRTAPSNLMHVPFSIEFSAIWMASLA
jgi:hypothetical protein